MMEEDEIAGQISPEMERTAAQRARDRAQIARWDLDVAIFFFAILSIIIILSFQEIGLEIVAPVAAFGLVMGWLMGWKKGEQAYQRFYDEELSKLLQELRTRAEETVEETLDETIEEKVQKALRERWR